MKTTKKSVGKKVNCDTFQSAMHDANCKSYKNSVVSIETFFLFGPPGYIMSE